MRLAGFLFVVPLLPGVLAAQDAAQSARTGQQALSKGEYTTAIYFLKQAVSAEPKHPSAWKDLCRAYLPLDQIDAAVDACLRQIDVNPQSSGVYSALGAALWRKGKHDEAIAALQQQAEVDTRAIGPHVALGHYYCALGRYADAVIELEKVVAQDPTNTAVQEDLGSAYLALGQTDKGLAMLNKLAQERSTTAVLNTIAYRLASHRVRLDLAERYAETAVTNATTGLIAGAEAPPSLGVLRQVVTLSHCWDTLGWVHFQQGNLDEAGTFIAAAWSLNQDGPVGDHMGQLAERRGQKQQAIHAYSIAVAAPDALPETRGRLEALLGPGTAAAQIDRRAETTSAGKLLPDKASADYYMIQAQKPAMPEALFIRGDDRLRPFAKTVQELTPAGVFPDSTLPKIVRRVTLTCPGQGGDCWIELLPAAAAVFAELNAMAPNTKFASEAVAGRPGTFRIGDGVSAPVPIYKPEPQYSKEALKAKYQGTVVLYVEVDTTGHPRNIKVMRSLGLGLDEKAIEAVGKWEFRPGMKDGNPVTVAATVEVNFRLLKDH